MEVDMDEKQTGIATAACSVTKTCSCPCLFKKEVRAPIFALILLSLGGILLHYRIHSPQADADNYLPLVVGLISIFVLPFLFNSGKTVALAYVINLLAVLGGTFMMAMFSITHWNEPVTFSTVLLHSTLADILILAAKLPLAHIILRHFRPLKPGRA
jgi:hypothetical protein